MSTVPDKLYYRIGEVETITEIPAYVLRYWESEFKLLRPKKNPAGQRLYRKADLELVLRIKSLLYEERLTLEGAKKRLRGEARGLDQMDLGLRGRHARRGDPPHARRACRPSASASPPPDPAARLEFAPSCPYNARWVGAWRSPVAHLTGGQGVAGSNPVAPTNFNRHGARDSCRPTMTGFTRAGSRFSQTRWPRSARCTSSRRIASRARWVTPSRCTGRSG